MSALVSSLPEMACWETQPPRDMAEVPIPEGVVTFKIVAHDNSRFGVTRILEGQVGDFTEHGHLVDGTVIDYAPPDIRAWTERRDYSPDQINRMGSLGSELLTNAAVLQYLPTALDEAKVVVENMTGFLVGRGEFSETEVSQTTVEGVAKGVIAKLGSIVDEMESGQVTIGREYEGLVLELDDLGVVLLDHKSKLRNQGLPIRLMARNYRRKTG